MTSKGHRAKAIKVGLGWTSVCADCPWMGGDHTRREPAEADAEKHRRGERWPWQLAPGEEWTPDRGSV